MNINVIRFIKSAAIVILGVFIIDWIMGYAGTKAIDRLPQKADKLSYVTLQLKTDILLVGSSRMMHHYNPDILQKKINDYLKTDLSIYNAGYGGHFIDFSCCWIECVLSRCTPKLIILETSDYELCSPELAHRITDLTPFYNNNPVVAKYVDALGTKEKIQVQSNLYKYNEAAIQLAKEQLSSMEEDFAHGGYFPLTDTMPSILRDEILAEKETRKSNRTLYPYSVSNFEHILEVCKAKGILLIVIDSPYFHLPQDTIIPHICAEHGVPFIDLTNHPTFLNNSDLFQDRRHLNDNGVNQYMEIVWEHIRPYLTK